MFGRKCLLTAGFLAAILGNSQLHAALPVARINSILPAGIQRGTSVEVVIDGADLEGLDTLYFSREGISAERIGDLRFRVTAAPDVPLGPVDVRAIGTWGVSNPRTFVVSSLNEIAETEPNDFPEQAQELPVGSLVNGLIGGRADVDYYQINLQEGQTVVLECEAERIDSLLDSVLAIFAPDGKALELSDRYYGRDARVDFTAPKTGTYRVRVHDLVYNGGGAYFYRLAAHQNPVVSYLFPPVVNPGSQAERVVLGRNLPNAQVQENATVQDRPLEATTVNVPPTEPEPFQPDQFLPPRASRFDNFAFRFEAGPPVLLGTTTLPIVVETEPNDQSTQAQTVELPVELVGRLDRKDDSDRFRFSAKKDQVIDIETISEQAGFPTDITLFVQKITGVDAESGQIQTQDVGEFDDITESVGGLSYITSTHDPIARINVQEDSEYLVHVRDRFAESRGDARFVYRLRIQQPVPDFRLLIAPADNSNPSSLLVRKGGTTSATVYAIRKGGFSGEISVRVEGLPSGVSAQPIVIGPGLVQAPIVFHAQKEAQDHTGTIEVLGTASINDTQVTRHARPAAILWPAGGNAPRPARIARSLPIAVRATAPYLITAQTEHKTIGQGAQLVLPVKLERIWADFTDKLTGIAAQFVPPTVEQAPVEIPAGQNEAQLTLYFKPDTPPGNYTFFLAGDAKIPFTKTPEDPQAKKAPLDVADPSLPIQVTVLPRPIEITLEQATPTLKPGDAANLKVAIKRHNGYNGPVRISLTLPQGISGLLAPEVIIPQDVNETRFPIQLAADLPVGEKNGLTIRGLAKIGDNTVPVDAKLQLKIAAN